MFWIRIYCAPLTAHLYFRFLESKITAIHLSQLLGSMPWSVKSDLLVPRRRTACRTPNLTERLFSCSTCKNEAFARIQIKYLEKTTSPGSRDAAWRVSFTS